VYQQPKNKSPKGKSGYWSKQEAVFFDVRDAMLWERHVLENGCKNVEIVPILG
jgi:hypothetical protein